MASCYLKFEETTVELNNTLILNYDVKDATRDPETGEYFRISIYYPDGVTAKEYVSDTAGTKKGDITAAADIVGSWTGEALFYSFGRWTTSTVHATVTGVAPPPPPPPPPPGEEYALFVYTTPGECTLELLDSEGVSIGVNVSTPAGYAEWLDLPSGYYTLKISKEGYNDYSKLINLTGDTTFRVTLGEQNLFDIFFSLIISGFESLLGWTTGTLFSKLGEMWDIIANFGGQIVDFFSDAVGSVVDWVSENAGAIFDWLGDNFSNFIDWLGEVGGDIAGFVGDKIGGALDWITQGFTDFVDWLNDVGGDVADYIGGAIEDFVDWSSEQLGGIWEGIQTFFGEAISGFVESFFNGLDTGIEEAKSSPLHSDEPVRNPVLKGLQKVVREHRKKHGRDETTGDKI